MLETLLADTGRAMELQTDGPYLPVACRPAAEPINVQGALLQWYAECADDSQDARGAPRRRGVWPSSPW